MNENMSNIPKNIKKDVLTRVKPTSDEQKHLFDVVDYLIKKINSNVSEMDLSGVSAQLVGSAARGTWLSGTHDLDIFILFPENTDVKYLEYYGLKIARKVAEEAENWQEQYAEHPYISLKFRGYDVDIVPCFRVQSASNIRSAVDRTPFHNKFVKENIKGLEDEVLILKQFMHGIGVYGSELKTRGFSGYFAELLIIHFGSFDNLLKSACNWSPGMVIDMMNHGQSEHDEPFVMIDPTDPGRNVAAALSINKLAEFVDKSRSFFESPSLDFFFPEPITPLNDSEINNRLYLRNSSVVAIVFKTPDVVEDVFYPQLYKLESSVPTLLENHEFTVFSTGSWAGDYSVILLELLTSTLPNVKKHQGPPVWIHKHADNFKSKYKNSDYIFSMYIENGAYVVEKIRKYTDVKTLIESNLLTCSLGKHIKKTVEKGFFILENDEICRIKDPEFRKYLRRWL
ncbi:CCA-adding enzyme [Methanohalobium evestigatum Z-7303]|uniref:CCA-adding enzyme n=1 Tax=Methanohalobium evestigatum (strain ATCC BAA-1072 / DSM 3721 / NBRC 107634 / OCM 161 / Z-7303) TaxID=644295 RepID=D7E8P5_METEZ|nr:CCA tRNA nucleotidyltransferase [Methanohalobium evestigatum]ADI73716.1 CCA-adding enzyme [Methanohalobium evestigatum Z-7303]